jgi:hypothetical protein
MGPDGSGTFQPTANSNTRRGRLSDCFRARLGEPRYTQTATWETPQRTRPEEVEDGREKFYRWKLKWWAGSVRKGGRRGG